MARNRSHLRQKRESFWCGFVHEPVQNSQEEQEHLPIRALTKAQTSHMVSHPDTKKVHNLPHARHPAQAQGKVLGGGCACFVLGDAFGGNSAFSLLVLVGTGDEGGAFRLTPFAEAAVSSRSGAGPRNFIRVAGVRRAAIVTAQAARSSSYIRAGQLSSWEVETLDEKRDILLYASRTCGQVRKDFESNSVR